MRPKLNPNEFIGKTYGQLTITAFLPEKSIQYKDKMVSVKCTCGTLKDMRLRTIIHNKAKLCGCCHVKKGQLHPSWTGYGEMSGKYFATIQWSAKDRNLEFSVTLRQLWALFLKQDRKCAFTGEILHFGPTGFKGKTASLDRIDSNKGYTIDNLQWVHTDINALKKNMSNERFIEICNLIRKNPNFISK